MVLRKLVLALISVGVLLPGVGHALAVKNEMLTKSALGESFDAEIELLEVGELTGEDIRVSLGTAEDFVTAGIDRSYSLVDLNFNVVVTPNGRSYIQVTSNRPVLEPYLNFLIRVSWPGNSIVQEKIALLDPPIVSNSTAVAAEPTLTPPDNTPLATTTDTPVASAQSTDVAPPKPELVESFSPPTRKPSKTNIKPANAPVEPSSYNEGEYLVKRGDTLINIVSSRYSGSSVAQAMIAIQQANAKAFANQNINQLKTGQLLKLPSDSEIREINAQEAAASVHRQASEWRSSKGLESQQVNATAPVAVEVKPIVAPQQEMKLLAPESVKKGVAGLGKDNGAEVKSIDEKKLKDNRAMADALKSDKDKLATKVGTLSTQVQDNDKKIAAQNAQLADLNAKLKAEQDKKIVSTAPNATPPVEVAKNLPAQPADVAQNTVPNIETSSVESKPVELTKIIEPPIFEDEEDNSLLYMGAGAVGLALVGGLFFLRRREDKKEEFPADDFHDAVDNLDISDDNFFLDDIAPVAKATSDSDLFLDEPQSTSAVSEKIANKPSAQQDLDPLDAAEQFLAQQRFPQAIGLLNKAVVAEPERADLRLRLLELNAQLNDWAGFDEQEAWFEANGDLEVLSRAETLKQTMTPPPKLSTPDDLLEFELASFGSNTQQHADDLPSLEDLELDFNSDVSASSAALATLNMADVEDFSSSTFNNLQLDDNLFAEITPPEKQEITEKPVFEEDSFDFSVNDTSKSAPAKSSASAIDFSEFNFDDTFEQKPTSKPFLDNDFAFDDLDKTTQHQSVDFDDSAFQQDVFKSSEPAIDDLNFSLDDMDLSENGSAQSSNEAATQRFEALTDFDFDATSRAPDAPSSIDETIRVDAKSVAVNSSNLDIDDEFGFLSDKDENTTKLDLARAYMDMGDKDLARDILQEVLSDGSSVQKNEAKDLLSQVM